MKTLEESNEFLDIILGNKSCKTCGHQEKWSDSVSSMLTVFEHFGLSSFSIDVEKRDDIIERTISLDRLVPYWHSMRSTTMDGTLAEAMCCAIVEFYENYGI